MKTEMYGGYDGEVHMNVRDMDYGEQVTVICKQGRVSLSMNYRRVLEISVEPKGKSGAKSCKVFTEEEQA